MKVYHNLLAVVALGLTLASSAALRAQEKLAANVKLSRLEAVPAQITLNSSFDYTQLLLTGITETGERIDITRMAQVEGAGTVVAVTPAGVIRPLADGAGELKLTVGGKSLTVPVKVSSQKEKYAVSFVRDVMPTMSKMGCNAGTCHGSAKGKNGFKLSLRG